MKKLFNVRYIDLKGHKDYPFETFELANDFYKNRIANDVILAISKNEYINVNIQLSNHKDEIVHEFIFESIPTNIVSKERVNMIKIKDSLF